MVRSVWVTMNHMVNVDRSILLLPTAEDALGLLMLFPESDITPT